VKAARTDRGLHLSLNRAMQGHPEAGNLAVAMARVRGAEIEYYAPVSVDLQRPHARDEIYIIASGSGTFTAADESVSFATGDVLFVPARVEHRFSGFSDDFATWVIFYGPEYPE
jgi:mannose-6-phosphate isomerase-like protein (cupin superfamily)